MQPFCNQRATWDMSFLALTRHSLIVLFVLIGFAMNTNANVLIVNENEAALFSRQQVLAAAGFSVLTARTRSDLFDVLTQQAIDVVLMDSFLPGVDGPRLIGTVKTQWPDTQIVVATESDSVSDAKEAIRLGASDYLVKPVLFDEIIGAVQRAALQKKWTLHLIAGEVPIAPIQRGKPS